MITILPVEDAIRLIRLPINSNTKRKISNSKVYLYRDTEVIIFDSQMIFDSYGDSDLSKTKLRGLRDKSELIDLGRKFHDRRSKSIPEDINDSEGDNQVQLLIESEGEQYYLTVNEEDLDYIKKDILKSGDKVISEFSYSNRSFSLSHHE